MNEEDDITPEQAARWLFLHGCRLFFDKDDDTLPWLIMSEDLTRGRWEPLLVLSRLPEAVRRLHDIHSSNLPHSLPSVREIPYE